MTTRRILAGIAALTLPLGFAPHVSAASTATAKFFMTGDCADGEFIQGEAEDCEITITVSNKRKNVAATVEVSVDGDEWEEYDSARTKSGRVSFEISPYEDAEEDDPIWKDGIEECYRVKIKRTAGVKLPKDREPYCIYFSTDPEDAEEEDKEFNEEMDRAQADNCKFQDQQNPNAKSESCGGGQPGGNKGGQPGGDKGGQPGGPQGQGGFDKAGAFNRACGSIGFPKDKCDQLVQTKSPKDAQAILGDQAEKWCAAIAESFGKKASCEMVLPNVFPPLGK